MLPFPSDGRGAVLSPSHARGRAFIQGCTASTDWESQVKHDLQELVLVEHVEGAGKVDSQHVDVLVCCPGIFERDDGLCLLHGR
jgi:hypothetical protein